MEKTFEITQGRIDHVSRLSSLGGIQWIYRVQFFVGERGPFSQEFTEAEFIPEKIRAAQEKVAATIRAL